MNKKQLYETIMRNVSREIKKTLNESANNALTVKADLAGLFNACEDNGLLEPVVYFVFDDYDEMYIDRRSTIEEIENVLSLNNGEFSRITDIYIPAKYAFYDIANKRIRKQPHLRLGIDTFSCSYTLNILSINYINEATEFIKQF